MVALVPGIVALSAIAPVSADGPDTENPLAGPRGCILECREGILAFDLRLVAPDGVRDPLEEHPVEASP